MKTKRKATTPTTIRVKGHKGLFRRIPNGKIFARIGDTTRSTGTTDPKQAAVWRAKQANRLHKKGDLDSPCKLTLEDICEDYITNLENDPEIRDAVQVKRMLRRVYDSVPFRGRLAVGITPKDGDEYRKLRKAGTLQYRRKKDGTESSRRISKVKDITINTELSYIHAACEYAASDRGLCANIEDFKVPKFYRTSLKGTARQGHITIEEMERIRPFFPISLQPYFVIAYRSGPRRMELLDVQWTQVDFTAQLIYLRSADTKTSKARVIPFLIDMEEILRKQWEIHEAECPECPYVFFWHKADMDKPIPRIRNGRNGKETTMIVSQRNRPTGSQYTRKEFPRITPTDLTECWDAAVKHAGFPALLIHDMRRSATTNIQDEDAYGQTEEDGMLLIGHDSKIVHREYDIKDIKRAKAAAARINAKHAEKFGPPGEHTRKPVKEMSTAITVQNSDPALERLLRTGTIEEIMEYRRTQGVRRRNAIVELPYTVTEYKKPTT